MLTLSVAKSVFDEVLSWRVICDIGKSANELIKELMWISLNSNIGLFSRVFRILVREAELVHIEHILFWELHKSDHLLGLIKQVIYEHFTCTFDVIFLIFPLLKS